MGWLRRIRALCAVILRVGFKCGGRFLWIPSACAVVSDDDGLDFFW